MVEFLKEVPAIRFMALRKYWYVLSALVVAGSIVLVFARGLNLTVDFTGGEVLELGFPQPVDLEAVRSALDAGGIEDFQVRTYGTASELEVRLPPAATGAASGEAERVVQALKSVDPGVKLNRTESVGPQVSQQLGEQASLAVLMTLLLVLIYVAFRFRWRFGVGSLVASLHDPIVAVGAIAVLGIPFDLNVVAALLTILGYSVNDTVVVFDRVRENMRKFKKMPLIDLLNLSLNDTLSRTIMTAGTTFLAVLALVLLGGPVIQGFSIAMLWGVIVGTYSSIWMACAMLVYTGVRDGSSIIKDEHDKAQAEFAAKP
jgi:preprotein translocase subunit SecF